MHRLCTFAAALTVLGAVLGSALAPGSADARGRKQTKPSEARPQIIDRDRWLRGPPPPPSSDRNYYGPAPTIQPPMQRVQPPPPLAQPPTNR